MYDQQDPRKREIPGQLFTFEERIFGMSLPQFLMNLSGLVLVVSLGRAIPSLPLRLIVCSLLGLLLLFCSFAKKDGYPLWTWLFLWLRFRLLPTRTQFLSSAPHLQEGGATAGRSASPTGEKKERPSVQQSWFQLSALEGALVCYEEPRRRANEEPNATFWVALELKGQHQLRYLPDADQIKLYERSKALFDGASFPLKFLSLSETIDPAAEPGFAYQLHMYRQLGNFPQLQHFHREVLTHLQNAFQHCLSIRHFLIVSASTREISYQQLEDHAASPWARIWAGLFQRKDMRASRSFTRDQLRTRCSIVYKAFRQLEVDVTLLEDASFLQSFLATAFPGYHAPSYQVEVTPEGLDPRKEQTQTSREDVFGQTHASPASHWWKRVRGLHTSFRYPSRSANPKIETSVLPLADLVAPSALLVQPDKLAVNVGGQTRYQRYFEVTDLGASRTFGWMEELLRLGLPIHLVYRTDPIPARHMIAKLETHRTKLASQRIVDQKSSRETKATQQVEVEQLNHQLMELARKRLSIHMTQIVLCLHASDPDRLEQRTRYLLSHLRDMQLRARQLRHQQDKGWQLCTATGVASPPIHSTNLPSDVLATFLNCSTGSLGTATGAFLGFAGEGGSRQPVYFNPWALSVPHCVVIGRSGGGKSWLVKVLTTGLMCLNVADVVVVDHDGDYDRLCDYLGPQESQRYDLARACPLNPLSLPFAPADIDPEDTTDFLAEHISNSLLNFVGMITSDTALTKGEEAFCFQAIRTCYARAGFTSEAIRKRPDLLLQPAPTFADLLATFRATETANSAMRQSFVECLEKVEHLFPAHDTTITLTTPLTVFNIKDLDSDWYSFMIYVVNNFLRRHRALKRDQRFLACVIEETSYMLDNPSAKKYLESGSRGYRKLGIAQITVSQHPEDFLREGKVILENAGTVFYLGMSRAAAQMVDLPEDLQRLLEEQTPGQAVMRYGRSQGALKVTRHTALEQLFSTTPVQQSTSSPPPPQAVRP